MRLSKKDTEPGLHVGAPNPTGPRGEGEGGLPHRAQEEKP